MAWTALSFGKHKGKTLPQVVFSDPDWFFWATDNDVFSGKGVTLETEVQDILYKATHIRIPGTPEQTLEAEYYIHPSTSSFGRLEIVPADRPQHQGGSATLRHPVIDLSVPHRLKTYDKLGGRNLMHDLKYILFHDSQIRLTKVHCERFFDDPANFA